jgi:CDP-diacylglycerol--glycerol-3-phosphate 3-phosphatidyltransferase
VLTVLHVAVGSQQHAVIPASPGGKIRTAFQVAMVICVIAVDGYPLWHELLIAATVLITVLWGADYCFGLRRGLAERVDGQQAAPGD